MRQQEAVLLPVHVVEHEEGIIPGIGTGVHDTELPAEVLTVRSPGVLPMEADIRDTDGAVVHLAKRCALMKHRMLLPELNHVAREIVELPIPLDEPPVEPVHRIILAVRVIVPEAGLAELVARVDQRGALAQHQQQPRVPPHLLPEKLDGLLPGRALLPTVPAVVLVGTVAVILMILFVVLTIIGEDIHQTHARDIGHILDARTVRWVLAHTLHERRQHALVALQDAAHVVLEAVVIVGEVTARCRCLRGAMGRRLRNLALPAVRPDLEAAQPRITGDDTVRRGADQVDAVDVIVDAPVAHDVHDMIRDGFVCKVQVDHDLHAVRVQGMHELPELVPRILVVGGEARFRRELQGVLREAPVIDAARRAELDLVWVIMSVIRKHDLVKFVWWHQLDRRDTERLEVRKLLKDALEAATELAVETGAVMLREAAHMETVDDAVLVRQIERPILSPGLTRLRNRRRLADRRLQRPGAVLQISEALPSLKHRPVRIGEDAAVRLVAVAELRQRDGGCDRQFQMPDIPDPIRRIEGDLTNASVFMI